ncbi:MAG: ABC transporter permease [Pseudobdellovibrionaceae bacterium]
MKKIFVIATISVTEIFRDRIFISLIIVALALMFLSLLLGQLSFAEQTRILAHFGMTSIHLLMVGLSLFLGCYALSREIDKQTYTTLLARPLSRTAFLLGKYFGLVFTAATSVVLLFAVLSFLLPTEIYLRGLVTACVGVVLESFVLFAASLFASTFIRPSTALFFTLGLFLFGHWLPDLMFFAEKSKSEAFIFFAQNIQYVVPNLYSFNWREIGMLETPPPISGLLWPVLHSLIWSAIFFLAASFVIRRKDLV